MADTPAPVRSDDTPQLSVATIWAYCLPAVGVAFPGVLMSIYLMKFSTDVLLVAPAAMGVIFGVGRIWDAISDPVAGYLSDRSSAARGRRRSWMLAAALPVAITTVMIWSPLPGLDGTALVLWMGLALIAYETAMTAFLVPHGALGMELTSNYHERTRLFGYRHVLIAGGSVLGMGGVFLLRTATEPRLTAFLLAAVSGAIVAGTIVFAAARLPERADFQGRGARAIGKSFSDVFRNPHGRLLLAVFAIENFGAASIGMLAPYVMEYLVKAPQFTELFILVYFVPQFALTPIWIRLAKRFGKKNMWVFSMSAMALGYLAMFFIEEGRYALIFGVVALLGLGGGCGSVVGPAIQADVIDYDEYQTGERKEGAYVAIWNFVRKAAAGVTAMMTGFVLQAVGFEPNVEQSENTKLAMRALIGLLPAVCYAFGTLIFLRFGLNEREHAALQRELEQRRAGGA